MYQRISMNHFQCCHKWLYYIALSAKCLKYFLKNPKLLELPPETVEDDVN